MAFLMGMAGFLLALRRMPQGVGRGGTVPQAAGRRPFRRTKSNGRNGTTFGITTARRCQSRRGADDNRKEVSI